MLLWQMEFFVPSPLFPHSESDAASYLHHVICFILILFVVWCVSVCSHAHIWDRFSLCCLGWPQTWDLLASASRVIGIIDECHHAHVCLSVLFWPQLHSLPFWLVFLSFSGRWRNSFFSFFLFVHEGILNPPPLLLPMFPSHSVFSTSLLTRLATLSWLYNYAIISTF